MKYRLFLLKLYVRRILLALRVLVFTLAFSLLVLFNSNLNLIQTATLDTVEQDGSFYFGRYLLQEKDCNVRVKVLIPFLTEKDVSRLMDITVIKHVTDGEIYISTFALRVSLLLVMILLIESFARLIVTINKITLDREVYDNDEDDS